jgi:thiamine-monophosphate kinase
MTRDILVGELSESELLARIFPRLRSGTSVLLGPGDDAAIVAAPDGRVVVSLDIQTQDQDFRLLWKNGYRTTGFDAGWKAAAQNLSDINAMGATATSLVAGLTLPPATPVSWVEQLADGLSAAIEFLGATGCSVAGGDLGRGTELSISVAVLGSLAGHAPVLRSGGRAGDQLALAGTVGRAAAGLALLESDVPVESLTMSQRELLDTQCRPVPPLAAGPAAARAGATAMLDISDGLVRDGARLAGASGVVVNLMQPALGAGRWRGPWAARRFSSWRSPSAGVHCDRLVTARERHNCTGDNRRGSCTSIGMGSLCTLGSPPTPPPSGAGWPSRKRRWATIVTA